MNLRKINLFLIIFPCALLFMKGKTMADEFANGEPKLDVCNMRASQEPSPAQAVILGTQMLVCPGKFGSVAKEVREMVSTLTRAARDSFCNNEPGAAVSPLKAAADAVVCPSQTKPSEWKP